MDGRTKDGKFAAGNRLSQKTGLGGSCRLPREARGLRRKLNRLLRQLEAMARAHPGRLNGPLTERERCLIDDALVAERRRLLADFWFTRAADLGTLTNEAASAFLKIGSEAHAARRKAERELAATPASGDELPWSLPASPQPRQDERSGRNGTSTDSGGRDATAGQLDALLMPPCGDQGSDLEDK